MASHVKASKFLSLILRHHPEIVGLTLDANGWAGVAELLAALQTHGRALSFQQLAEMVAADSKKRYSFNEDKTKIRANQGHSIDVDLNLTPVTPPTYLYHGTAKAFVASIRSHGLQKQGRNHVHLSTDRATATQVGQRHGVPVVLCIRAGAMCADGYCFFCSANNVWLTAQVPAKYIVFD